MDANDPARRSLARRVTSALAWLLLTLWGVWWALAVWWGALPGASVTWIPALPVLAADFQSIDHVARLFVAGHEPTRLTGDWVCMLYPYPPVVNRAFGWVALVSTSTATRLWLAALSAIYVGGAVAAWKARGALRLPTLPVAVVVVALVYSSPALLAMERGQIDPLVVPALGLAAWLLQRPSGRREVLAGAVLGLSAWLKYYPAVAAVGLLALGRTRALAAFVVVAVAIGAYDRAEVARSVAIGGRWTALHEQERALGFMHLTKHAVADVWKPLWVRAHRPWRYLARVPAALAAGVLLVPAVVLVSRGVRQAGHDGTGPLIFPYFLWLTAVGTFAMPTSIDYSLVPLPLAALAVWGRRDRVAVHAGLGLLWLWWQPFALPLDGRLLFACKLAGLYAVAASLSARAAEVRVGPYRITERGPNAVMRAVRSSSRSPSGVSGR